MKKAALLILMLAGLTPALYAQKENNSNAAPAKRLNSMDSLRVKDLFFSAIRQKTIDNTRLASELFNQVLAIDPNNDASMYELANLQKAQNNYQAAEPLLEQATSLSPNNEWYWLSLADSYEKTNNIPKLQNVLAQLIRLSPDKPAYYLERANTYFLQKDYPEALQQLARVEAITGLTDELQLNRQRIYLAQGKIDKAAEELQKLIASDPNQLRYYLLLAELYNSNGLNDKAIAVLSKAAALPDTKTGATGGMLHMALADVYRDNKNPDQSFAERKIAFANPDVDLEQKIRVVQYYVPRLSDPKVKQNVLELARLLTVAHPDSDKSYAIYGDMLVQDAQYREAKPVYKKSVSINAQSYQVHEQLVRIDMAESDFDGAIKDGEYALSYFPNQAWMNYLVGVAWQQNKNYNKALGYLKNAAGLEASDRDMLSQCYSVMGDCYHAISDNRLSDDAYDKALTYNPDNAFTLNNYAYYLSLRNERLDKAAEMSARSNTLQPSTASFEDTYAWILFRQKKYSEAKTWIEKSLVHDKDNSAVKTEHYGDILYFTGDTAAALKNWQKAKAQGAASPALDKKINEQKYTE